jgi:hypothetical protein
MRGIVAGVLAIALLWIADVELNAGRYGEAIKRAAETVLER